MPEAKFAIILVDPFETVTEIKGEFGKIWGITNVPGIVKLVIPEQL